MNAHHARGHQAPRQGPGITMLRQGGESVLCDGDGRPLYSLNATAAALWELCDGETTVDEIVEAVCLVCKVEREQARADLTRTLSDLSRSNLIEW